MSGIVYSRVPLDIVAQFSMNQAQAAATYDLCTASGGDVFIWDISWYQVTAGATFTSCALQSNDTTAFVIVNSTDGAVANLTAGKNITLTWPKVQKPLLRSGKKLQFTLAGSTGTGTAVITVVGMSVNGGTLV